MRSLAAILLAATTLAQSSAAETPKLVYTVILSRHGVRSPTATNEALREYSAAGWPEWGVAPGELTEHGRRVLGILGRWYREWLAQDGLLTASACEAADTIHVRADVGQRTTESARVLTAAMFPGCGVKIHGVAGNADPLFHSVAAGVAHVDAAMASAAVLGRIGGHPEALASTLGHAFQVLEEVLGKQSVLSLPASVGSTKDGLADIRGALKTGSTMAENLLLEYADGKTGADLGWGRLDETRLNEVMAIHTAYADLTRRTAYLARVQGSNLVSHILHSLEQASSGKTVPGALGKPGDRMLLLAGHDTNISHVAGLLNLSWLLPGYQRDDTPPGGALVWRLWRGAGGSYTVETLYIAQSLSQMRDAAPLSRASPPAIAHIFVPGCENSGVRYECGWQTFRQVVSQAVDPADVDQR